MMPNKQIYNVDVGALGKRLYLFVFLVIRTARGVNDKF